MESTKLASNSLPSPYTYTYLPTERTCRLIRLKRDLHPATEAVQVELVEADIDNSPAYDALSYAVISIRQIL
jgi:hypothetical protein